MKTVHENKEIKVEVEDGSNFVKVTSKNGYEGIAVLNIQAFNGGALKILTEEPFKFQQKTFGPDNIPGFIIDC